MDGHYPVNAVDCPIPTSSRMFRTQDLWKHPGWSPGQMTFPGSRGMSGLLLSQVRSSRTCPLPGGVENSTLSLPALWGSHLSGWNCAPHTLWTRTWHPSMTCDQHSVWESGHSKLFWKGVWWIFLQVSVQLGLGFGVWPLELNCGFPCSLGFGIWLRPRNRHIPQRPDALASSAPHIMEFYWSGPEARMIIPCCLAAHESIPPCVHLIAYCVAVSNLGPVTSSDGERTK